MPNQELDPISGFPLDSPYVVIDKLTGNVVYRTTYRHRNRARRWADRKDLQHGAVRYRCKLLQG